MLHPYTTVNDATQASLRPYVAGPKQQCKALLKSATLNGFKRYPQARTCDAFAARILDWDADMISTGRSGNFWRAWTSTSLPCNIGKLRSSTSPSNEPLSLRTVRLYRRLRRGWPERHGEVGPGGLCTDRNHPPRRATVYLVLVLPYRSSAWNFGTEPNPRHVPIVGKQQSLSARPGDVI